MIQDMFQIGKATFASVIFVLAYSLIFAGIISLFGGNKACKPDIQNTVRRVRRPALHPRRTRPVKGRRVRYIRSDTDLAVVFHDRLLLFIRLDSAFRDNNRRVRGRDSRCYSRQRKASIAFLPRIRL